MCWKFSKALIIEWWKILSEAINPSQVFHKAVRKQIVFCVPNKMQVLDFQILAFFFFLFAPHLHHKNLQIAGVLPGIACTFIGKLPSVPSFFGVSRAVSLCFCAWSIVTWKAPNECQDVWVWLHPCFHRTRLTGYRLLCGTPCSLYIRLKVYEVYTPEV